MNLVDELQAQMPEGKYLEAMNALRDLHVGRVRPPPQPVRPEPALPPALVLPEGYVRLTRADEARMASMRERRRHHENNLHPVVKAWQRRDVQRAVEGIVYTLNLKEYLVKRYFHFDWNLLPFFLFFTYN